MTRSRPPRALAAALVMAAAATLAIPTAARSQSPGTELEPTVVNYLYRDVVWGPPGTGPRSPMGVQTSTLTVDATTGGRTYLARFPAGSHFDLHWHTHPEYVVVMSGRVTLELGEETHALRQGDYVIIPGAMNHSWDVPEGGAVVILVRRGGPADFNYVDP